MELLNLKLDSETGTKIIALGITWDLHDLCFRSLKQNTGDIATFAMEWEYCGYGDLAEPPCARFELLFRGVSRLEIGPRNKEMPLNEDECLDLYQCVDNPSTLVNSAYGRYPARELSPDYLLLFDFRGGQKILVAAETVEFVPL